MLESRQVNWARWVGVFAVACCLALGVGCSDSGDERGGASEPDGISEGEGKDASEDDASKDDASKGDAGVEPTCDDGLKNGDEVDVDCGGSCEACAPQSCEVAGCAGEREVCVDGACVPGCRVAKDCGDAQAFACTDGACVDLCQGVSCGDDEYCYAGECRARCTNHIECLELRGFLSCNEEGACVAPCDGVTCEAGTQCYRGECYAECDPNAWDEECAAPTQCLDERQGICVPTDCSQVNCGMNESCYQGRCIGG